MKRLKQFRKSVFELWQTLAFCLRISWESSRLYTLIRLLAQVLTAVFALIVAYIMKFLLDALSNTSGSPDTLRFVFLLIIAYSIFKLFDLVFNKLDHFATGLHNDILSNYLDNQMMKVAIDADLEFFDSAEYYDAFEKAKGDSYSLINVLWHMITALRATITLISSAVILGQVNIIYCLAIFASSVPSAIFSQKYSKKLYLWDIDNMRDKRRMGYIYGTITSKGHAQDIRQFRIGEYILNKHIRIWSWFFSQRKKVINKQTVILILTELLPEIMMTFILFSIVGKIVQGYLSVGDFTLYTNILSNVTFGLVWGVGAMLSIYDDKLKIENLARFSRFKNKTKEQGSLIIQHVKSIQFINVYFTYPGTNIEVLKNVNFMIKERTKTTFVGLNGAGKSTIIKLLLRFYDASKGKILVNGRDIVDFDLNSLRSNFSSCLQTSFPFAFSMRDNIAISDIDRTAGDAEVLEALAMADADSLLNRADMSLDTYLSKSYDEDGVELSGGQNAKIILGRTFYRRGNVVIFDEPSASLDPEAEHKLFQIIDKLSEKKTCIYTSHRLANVVDSDLIIVIEEGRVIEQGTHRELIQDDTKYAKLFKCQASKYVDEVC